MSIIPEVRAVKQLKQYYQMMEDAKASMQKGGGKRKKGGTRHKNLGNKINQLQKKIYNLEQRIGDTRSGKHKNLGIKINEIEKKIKHLRGKIAENHSYIDNFASNINTNEQTIGLIESWINYKLHTINNPEEKTALHKWSQHLNNMDDSIPMNRTIIRNAGLYGTAASVSTPSYAASEQSLYEGGRRKRKSRKKRRRKKTKRKRRRNKKTRRKKSRK